MPDITSVLNLSFRAMTILFSLYISFLLAAMVMNIKADSIELLSATSLPLIIATIVCFLVTYFLIAPFFLIMLLKLSKYHARKRITQENFEKKLKGLQTGMPKLFAALEMPFNKSAIEYLSAFYNQCLLYSPIITILMLEALIITNAFMFLVLFQVMVIASYSVCLLFSGNERMKELKLKNESNSDQQQIP